MVQQARRTTHFRIVAAAAAINFNTEQYQYAMPPFFEPESLFMKKFIFILIVIIKFVSAIDSRIKIIGLRIFMS